MVATGQALPPETVPHCTSEVGTLEQVLICRPDPRGLEAGSRNPKAHGFRGPTDVAGALEEWNAFGQLLSDAGVIVRELGALTEYNGSGYGNRHFTRDLALVAGNRCLLASPLSSHRRKEAALLSDGLRDLGIAPVSMCSAIEFGDVLLGREGLVIAGYGPRTHRAAIVELHELIKDDGWVQWLVVEFAVENAALTGVHLDLCCNLVGRDIALVLAPLLKKPAILVEEGIERHGSFGELLKGLGFTTVPFGLVSHEAAAINLLSVAPDCVISYADALRTDLGDVLARSGIRVLDFPGANLLRTGGGPRCLSMPLVRT